MAAKPKTFSLTPKGPFDLRTAQDYFGGWPTVDGAIVMAFPVEGWRTSGAVLVRQQGKAITGEVHAGGKDADHAWAMAVAAMSLDRDGGGFARVARRDPVLGRLWEEHLHIRPVLFQSPYEAACAFIIGHRISIAQTRKIRARLAEDEGEALVISGQAFHAFPDPHKLLRISAIPGVAAPKVERLHAIAEAALAGRLDREHLRSMPIEDALAEVRTLPGVGAFFAEGIVTRGAGVDDYVTDDDLTPRAVELAYGLTRRPTHAEVLDRAEAWKPYRMWANVLLHVWLRRQPRSVVGPRRMGRGADRRKG
jgi:DNA-3-methyladenine glycosylase II